MCYAHTLLFQCPKCHLPTPVSRVGHAKNPQVVGSTLVRLRCNHCNSTAEVQSSTAKMLWVTDWGDGAVQNEAPKLITERAAILINCSRREAAQIHQRADLVRRPVSNYILSIVMPAILADDEFYANFPAPKGVRRMQAERSLGPRTTILLRCSTDESRRIRKAATLRNMFLGQFVLSKLKGSWVLADNPAKASVLEMA